MIVTHMPLERFPPSSEPPPSRTSSLLSRFSSPLSKRSRNVFDFSIEPDEPLKLHQPGDVVKGHIVLNVLKGFDITHLVIALHGYAKVYKHQQEGHSVPEELVNGKGTKGFEYHGNGLASLFQDEQTLCGSGFLRKQMYKFGFELEFPTKSLPSALNFERGTVAYMISATVTRPTAIAPTTTKCHKVHFRDRIDIQNMYTPKIRMISLEPISKRGKMKKVKTNSSVPTQDTPTRGVLTRNNTGTSSHSASQPVQPPQSIDPPLSPAPSDHTVATTNTTSTGSFRVMENGSPTKKTSPQTSDTRSGDTSLSAHTITATTELPRFGALAGDVVPIKVSVSHTKARARGVIIATLYRQGRIDLHPVLPLAGKGKDKKGYEDIYPRSRTGLGGLYFSTSSPSSVFRKDLSQSSTMMIVNPATMTAEVRTSVKVPEDVFPTISNVPGGMISFTYHVEVVIDLTGKLGESKFLPSLTSNGPTFSIGVDNGNQITADWANSILDTTALRRTKSVVTFELPLIVGTKDSRRIHQPQLRSTQEQQTPEEQTYEGDEQNYGYDWQEETYDPEGYRYDEYDGYYYDENGYPLDNGWYDYNQDFNGVMMPTAPASDLISPPGETQPIDEKTRLRRQEELLMPSQPPEIGTSSRSAQDFTPTAPIFPEFRDSQPISILAPPANPSAPDFVSRASARSTETIVPHNLTTLPSLPDNQMMPPHMDDKQELERQRLLAQASAPPTDDDDAQASSSRPTAPPATAPMMDEDEVYLAMALSHQHMSNDQLPQYRR